MSPRLAAHQNAILLNGALFARIDALHRRRSELRLSAEQAKLLDRVHLDFTLAGARLAPDAKARLGRDRREARRPVDAVQPERAGRRIRLRAGAARRARPRRIARARPARRARSRDRAWQARRVGDHAVALADRAVPHVLRPPRPSRAGLPRVDAPRRERRRARQPSDRARDPRAAARAGDAARPQDVRGLRAGRPDGGHAGRRRPAARPRVGPGEGPGAAGARCAARARAVARREHPDRAVGLALLRGKGAQGALRFRRSGAQALFPARPHAERRVRLREPALRHPFRARGRT